MIIEPNDIRRNDRRNDDAQRLGRGARLGMLWAEQRQRMRTRLVELADALSERTAAGSDRVRQGLARSFETRIAVAAAVVLASAVVGYALGGRFVAAGSAATDETFDDVLAHAEHAFSLEAPEGVDVEGGELVAQYAPVSIDALPVHQDRSERLTITNRADSAGPFADRFDARAGILSSVERVSIRSLAEAKSGDAAGPAAAPAIGSDELTLVTRGEIGKRESLAASLRRQGVSPAAILLISTELRKVFDFRRSRSGDTYRLAQDSDGRVLDFAYAQGREESYTLTWKGTRYVASKQTETLEPHVAKIAGVVDGSFYDAITALGEQSSLATEFAKILAWDLDFSRSVQQGDEFAILYERLYAKRPDGESVYVRPGKILAGRYSGRAGEHTVVYYEDGDGHGAYFRPDGSSVERAFLAAPLEFSRITSRFTNARRHPILNITRPHPGIDYAAPFGTPIFSVGDGIVEFRARQGASGNLVRIRHTGGYTSHYAHLSSFARGLNVGDRVKQKQVIGYVGSTGLSTGPHVCFRVKKNGQYVDPLRIAKPAGPTIEYDRIDHFRDVRDQRLADLGRGPFVAANEAL
ncbi:peptidoglycan DD-metalloendopeptidase family protein [Myxococcota bacterium]|nr:peptidoglycan DD-metalloendopeptidase family protein [Myxococcota bacterium]